MCLVRVCRFLYDESSAFHKFYQQRLKELLEGRAARQQDEMEETAADADAEDEQGEVFVLVQFLDKVSVASWIDTPEE